MKAVRRVNRRDFLKTGGVLVLGVSLYGCSRESTPIPIAPKGPAGPSVLR